MGQTASAAASATNEWLTAFQKALTARDADAAAALFANESYWRDIVSFTWNITTVEGPAGVADLLRATLDDVDPAGFRVTEEPAEEDGVITAWIAFETSAGRGSGLLRLVGGKAFTLLTTLDELKGYEEPLNDRRPDGVRHGAYRDRVTWAESRAREATKLGYTEQPEVLIIGGVAAVLFYLGSNAVANLERQGIAGGFLVKIVGSYSNIVGLPLYETMTLLGGEGYPIHFGWLTAVT